MKEEMDAICLDHLYEIAREIKKSIHIANMHGLHTCVSEMKNYLKTFCNENGFFITEEFKIMESRFYGESLYKLMKSRSNALKMRTLYKEIK